jgi:hypothetical protein
MITTNITPEKGVWTLVATDPGYVRIKSNALSDTRWWCVAVTNDGEPEEEVTGEKYLGNQFAEFSQVTGEVYVLTRRDGDEFAITIGPDPAGQPADDREVVVTTYRVINDFDDSSVGDVVTLTQVIDVSGSGVSTVATSWRNQTTSEDLTSAPAAADLELVGSVGLSNAQLRSAAVQIVEKDDPFTVRDRTPDNSKDVIYDYADGTSETFFFTTDGDLAGKGARE